VLGMVAQDGVAEVVQATGGTQRLVLAQVLDGKVGELQRRVLNEVAEDGFFVVADQVDLVDRGNLADGSQAVPDDGMPGDVEEGLETMSVSMAGQKSKSHDGMAYLRDIEGERTETSATGGAADLRETICQQSEPEAQLAGETRVVLLVNTYQDNGLGHTGDAVGPFAERKLQRHCVLCLSRSKGQWQDEGAVMMLRGNRTQDSPKFQQ